MHLAISVFCIQNSHTYIYVNDAHGRLKRSDCCISIYIYIVNVPVGENASKLRIMKYQHSSGLKVRVETLILKLSSKTASH